MPRNPDDVAWVAESILTRLRWARGPVPRDELTASVMGVAIMVRGRCWNAATAARRVREALEALLEGDSPVISAGGGFKLASRATAAERDRAAHLAERQAVRLLTKARRIRAVVLPGEPVNRDLELTEFCLMEEARQ